MDVVGVGALNLDRLYTVEKIASPGEHVPVKRFNESPGGSAANTIAGISRLGFRTGFIGAVGNDTDGKIMLDSFKKDNVDVSHVKKSKNKTGIIIGLVDSRGERALYPYPGANNDLLVNNEDISYADRAKFVHLSSFVNEKQLSEQKKLVSKLKNAKVSFSPGTLYAELDLEKISAIIEKSFIIFINDDEIKKLTGKNYTDGSKKLLNLGAKIVVVTLGKNGCYIRTKNEEHEIPAVKTRVVDTTGAGDAFNAGFLYGLLKNKNLKECGKLGNKIASYCIQKLGAREALPYKKDLKL